MLALELGPHGITVNALGIGATVNERNLADDPRYAEHWAEVTPTGRVGTPQDVASALVYLVSPEAAHGQRPHAHGRRRLVERRQRALGGGRIGGRRGTHAAQEPGHHERGAERECGAHDRGYLHAAAERRSGCVEELVAERRRKIFGGRDRAAECVPRVLRGLGRDAGRYRVGDRLR